MRALVTPESSAALRAHLLALLQGFRATCIVATAIKLGVLDHLRAGPASAQELADQLGAHRSSLWRFLRALEVLGLVEPRANGVALTTMGRLLLDPDAGLRERAILTSEEYLPAWLELGHSVMTGEPAFPAVFGMNVWEHRKAHPELGECFDRAMADQQARARRSVLAAYDFSGSRLVVDVGGGRGALMAQAVLAAAGVLDRCRVAGGSFLDTVPAEGDVYILQYILHDWDDRDCATILRNCRAAMGPSGALLVVENIVAEGALPAELLAMLDLHMMVMLGGRERTLSEYRSLLHSAGLELRRCVPGRTSAEIIVASPDGAEHPSVGPAAR
jgi:O-methyltransferase domain/Dimerisation domain